MQPIVFLLSLSLSFAAQAPFFSVKDGNFYMTTPEGGTLYINNQSYQALVDEVAELKSQLAWFREHATDTYCTNANAILPCRQSHYLMCGAPDASLFKCITSNQDVTDEKEAWTLAARFSHRDDKVWTEPDTSLWISDVLVGQASSTSNFKGPAFLQQAKDVLFLIPESGDWLYYKNLLNGRSVRTYIQQASCATQDSCISQATPTQQHLPTSVSDRCSTIVHVNPRIQPDVTSLSPQYGFAFSLVNTGTDTCVLHNLGTGSADARIVPNGFMGRQSNTSRIELYVR